LNAEPSTSELRFARTAIRRKRVYLVLSIVGLSVAAAYAVHVALRRAADPSYPVGVRIALMVLILLNARGQLRQYRYAGILEKTLEGEDIRRSPAGGADPATNRRGGSPVV